MPLRDTFADIYSTMLHAMLTNQTKLIMFIVTYISDCQLLGDNGRRQSDILSGGCVKHQLDIRLSVTARSLTTMSPQLLFNYQLNTGLRVSQYIYPRYPIIHSSHEHSISISHTLNLITISILPRNSLRPIKQSNQVMNRCTSHTWRSTATNSLPADSSTTHFSCGCSLVPGETSRSQTWRKTLEVREISFVLSSPLHENPVLLQCPLHALQSPSLSHSPTGLHGWGFWSTPLRQTRWDKNNQHEIHEHGSRVFFFFFFLILLFISSVEFRFFRVTSRGLPVL